MVDEHGPVSSVVPPIMAVRDVATEPPVSIAFTASVVRMVALTTTATVFVRDLSITGMYGHPVVLL
jgi:hypothetical protein